ncbi:MAG: terminase small subunit [Roseburia sp.]|nr:terminase small subunit [Roseburia sp.]MBQ8279562.1 terminase small subunit [Roseburia sp.]
MALSDKQKRFCDEYLLDMNANQAALRAGYKEQTARFASRWINANENLQKPNGKNKSKFNPEMREYIDARMAEKEKALIADQDEVMRYLSAVMRREKTDSVVVTLSRETSTYVPDAEGKMRKQTVKEEVPEIVEIPAQLRDANKAAELLGKAYGIYTDRIETDIDMDLNINIDYGDDA